jgi:hypothetical protein
MRIQEGSVQLHNDILKTHLSIADVWCMYQGAKATRYNPVQPQQLNYGVESQSAAVVYHMHVRLHPSAVYKPKRDGARQSH